MKKRYQILSLCTVFAAANLLMPSIGSSAAIKSDKGEAITITVAAPLTQTMTFQPSPQVKMIGATSASAFSVAAAHLSVLGKSNGEAYAMSSEQSGLFIKKQAVDGATGDPKIGASAGLLDAAYKLPGP